MLHLAVTLTFIDTMQVFVLELGQLSNEVSLSFASSPYSAEFRLHGNYRMQIVSALLQSCFSLIL